MDAKKSPKADLESKRTFFIQLGLIATLCIVWFAFEWKSYDRQALDLGDQNQVVIDEEQIIQTERNEPPPPPPQQEQTTVIEIVDDDKTIENEIEINVEADQKTQVQAYIPVEVEAEAEEAEIFTVVEDAPGYPGGEEARMKFLRDNIKYPQMAKESGIQGTVYVTFVVERDGSVTDVRVLRGIGGGCDDEAIRVVKLMPRWNPGKQRGKAVRVQFNVPIKFTLSGN